MLTGPRDQIAYLVLPVVRRESCEGREVQNLPQEYQSLLWD